MSNNYLEKIKPKWKRVAEQTKGILLPELSSVYELLRRFVARIGALLLYICSVAFAVWYFSLVLGMFAAMFWIVKLTFLWLVARLGVK